MSSVLCLGAVAGIPAIVLGVLARKNIERSQGTRMGLDLAASGILTGLFGTVVSVLALVVILGGTLRIGWSGERAPLARATVPAAARLYGTLEVIDLDDREPLSVALVNVAKDASTRGRTVILQTYVHASRECADVAYALADPSMQRALANVTLMRVDVDVFETDLRVMRVDTNVVPWFYILDAAAQPTDAISANEWDENTATDMAPVLGAFVKGTLAARRSSSPLGTDL